MARNVYTLQRIYENIQHVEGTRPWNAPTDILWHDCCHILTQTKPTIRNNHRSYSTTNNTNRINQYAYEVIAIKIYAQGRLASRQSVAVALPSGLLPSIWWRHQMETFSALLVICAKNSPVTGVPAQRPVTRGLMLSFIWINAWVNSGGAGDLRHHHSL